MNTEDLALLIRRNLENGGAVDIEGLGVFARDRAGRISLYRDNRPRIFIAYAMEDAAKADRLYDCFLQRGYAPWLDRRRLLPGQNWPRRIREAIESADFFLPCFSRNSVRKRGGFQAEIHYALECAANIPLDEVYLLPVRLDDCRVPARIQRETQYVDLFPQWEPGFK